jgi:hypothetical protein
MATRTWLRSPRGLILLGFLAIAAFFLIAEHRAHAFGVLPCLLVLSCLLLHRLMHGGGHGGPAGHAHRPSTGGKP